MKHCCQVERIFGGDILMTRMQKYLWLYTATVSVAFFAMLLMGFAKPSSTRLDEITVQRINVIEPDGTLRMVISNHAKLPGIIVRGKEEAFARPQAGMLFYNDEGSENGGLIFGGHKNPRGEVVDSGGSLSFDKYDSNQIVQLAGVDDREDRFAGLIVTDSSKDRGYRRVWVGRDDKGSATLALMDASGKKRISMEVSPEGVAQLSFYDANGKVLNRLSPSAQ
jgi:hypothetical protein